MFTAAALVRIDLPEGKGLMKERYFKFGHMRAAAMLKATILIAVALVMLVPCGAASAQGTAPTSAETLTLDQAIALALRDNHAMKIAKLGVERTDDDISATKTFRLPSMQRLYARSE